MRVRTVFVAYPYSSGPGYRSALQERFAGSGIELRYADEELANTHVMDKIRRMMSEADICFFDVSGNNPNVLFELGYALGAQEPGFVVIQNDAVASLSADIVGWDSLRYRTFEDLAEQVFDRVSKGRVPVRRNDSLAIEEPSRSARDILTSLRFGVPASDHARLVVYVVPSIYNRFEIDRATFGTPPFRAQDLCDSVFRGPNATHYGTFFWPGGFNYAHRPGPDFVEVYPGLDDRSSERRTNFRVYLSGVVTYMQRLRRKGPGNNPFLYVKMYEEVVEMALIAISDVRERWGFQQASLKTGTIVLNAPDLRVSEGMKDFISIDDDGRALAIPSDIEWIPEEPQSYGALGFNAKEVAEQFGAELLASLD